MRVPHRRLPKKSAAPCPVQRELRLRMEEPVHVLSREEAHARFAAIKRQLTGQS